MGTINRGMGTTDAPPPRRKEKKMSPTDSSPNSNPSNKPPKAKFSRVKGNKNIGHLLSILLVVICVLSTLAAYAYWVKDIP